MSFKKKLVLFTVAVILVVSLSTGVAFGLGGSDGIDALADNPTGTYTVTAANGATMTVNKENLSLVIVKDGRTWYSGNRYEDDGLVARNRAKVTDAVTVTYRNISTSPGNETTDAFTRINNSSVRFTEKSNGFDARIKLGSPVSITFTLRVRFDGETVKTTIPFDSIEEDSDVNRLQSIQVYPYFDSSYRLTEGNIFLPDGSGALIDLSQSTSAKTEYSAKVYGEDYGIASTNSVKANAPQRVTMPVVATLYPDGGTMAVATSGAEYSRVNASVNGIGNNPYNRTYFSFHYREEYVKSYESAGGIKTDRSFPKSMNKFDAEVTHTLLSENCNIADVANMYRDNFLDIKKAVINNVGMRLQFLMMENKQGMFGRTTVDMTSTEFVEKVAKEVVYYCDNLNIALTGYQRGGLGGADPSIFPMSGSSSYKDLSKELAKIYVQLTFVVDYIKAHNRAGISNYNLTQNISEQFIVMPDIRAGSTATFNLVKPTYTDKLMSKDLDKLQDYKAGIEFNSLGSLLFSGYKQEVFTRTDLMKRHVKAVKNAKVYSALSNPNDYMFGVMNSYVDIPMEYSAFIIETESVPFLQMVLSGYVPMYSSALNLDYTGQDLILRLIDSNVYPSFILTEEDAIELYGTDSQGIFTSSFDIWKYSVKETYEQVNQVLKEVVGQTVVSRVMLQPNVYVTTYSNGVKIVVNYSKNMIDVQGRQIAAQSAVAIY